MSRRCGDVAIEPTLLWVTPLKLHNKKAGRIYDERRRPHTTSQTNLVREYPQQVPRQVDW